MNGVKGEYSREYFESEETLPVKFKWPRKVSLQPAPAPFQVWFWGFWTEYHLEKFKLHSFKTNRPLLGEDGMLYSFRICFRIILLCHIIFPPALLLACPQRWWMFIHHPGNGHTSCQDRVLPEEGTEGVCGDIVSLRTVSSYSHKVSSTRLLKHELNRTTIDRVSRRKPRRLQPCTRNYRKQGMLMVGDIVTPGEEHTDWLYNTKCS